MEKKIKTAENKGAIGVIFLKKEYITTDLNIKKYLQYPSMKMHNNQKIKEHLPVFFVNEELLNLDSSIVVDFSTNVNITKTAENVLGYIPGKTDQVLVISAHYDHIGYDQGEICNGADDDGSGSVALSFNCQRFSKSIFKRKSTTKRNFIFISIG